MKFKIETKTLLSSLNKVSHIINNKSPIPSLNGIYFNVDANNLTLIGSDSDITIKCQISKNLEIIKQGKIVLPKFIVEIIKKINDEWIIIELIDNSLVLIKSEKSEFKINGILAENFPNIDFSFEGDKIVLNSALINSIISETTFATSNEEVRPVLTGVNFNCKNNILTCVATDSFRLAKKEIELSESYNFNINVPAKCLNEAAKLIKDDEFINIYISNQKIVFDLNEIIIQSRLINGNYPDVSHLIPNEFQSSLTINKRDFLESLDRANILSINTSNFTVTLEKNSSLLTLSSKSQEVGSINEIVNYLNFEGNELLISFNSRFVNEAIKSFSSEILTLYFNGVMNPIIIKSEDSNTVQLVLPIKTY